MARQQERQRTQRTAVEMQAGERPRIQEQRRFFTAQGNDRAVREARALERLFSQATATYGDWIDEQNYQGKMRASDEAAKGGTRNEEDKNAAYHRVWDKLDDQRALQDAARDLPAYMEEKGAEDLDEKGRQALANQWMKERFAGLDQPEESRGYTRDRQYLATGLEQLEAEVLGGYRTLDLTVEKERKRTESMNALELEYANNERVVPEGALADFMERYDAFLDGPEKHAALAEDLLDFAVRMKDMKILDAIPTHFASGDQTFMSSPKFRDIVQKARSTIADANASDLKDAHEAWRLANRDDIARMKASHTDRAKHKDPALLNELPEYAKPGPNGRPPIYTEKELESLYDQYYKAEAESTLTLHKAEVFGSGNALLDLTKTEYDEHYQSWKMAAIESFKKQHPDATPEQVGDAVRMAAYDLAIANNRMPSELLGGFRVNVNNPEKFKQSAQDFNYIEAQRPGWLKTQLPDAQYRDYVTFNRILEDAADEDVAVEQFKDVDRDRMKFYKKKDVDTAIEEITSVLTDKPWSLNNYDQYEGMIAEIRDEVEYYVSRGFSLDEARERAQTGLQERRVWVGEHMYRRDSGWPQDQNEAEETYEAARLRYAAEFGVDEDEVTIRPHSTQHNKVVIRNNDPLPGSKNERTVEIGTLVADRQRERGEKYDAEVALMEAAQNNEALLEEARDRAFARMFPNLANQWLEPGERASRNAAARRQWEALSQKDRDALTMRELTYNQE